VNDSRKEILFCCDQHDGVGVKSGLKTPFNDMLMKKQEIMWLNLCTLHVVFASDRKMP